MSRISPVNVLWHSHQGNFIGPIQHIYSRYVFKIINAQTRWYKCFFILSLDNSWFGIIMITIGNTALFSVTRVLYLHFDIFGISSESWKKPCMYVYIYIWIKTCSFPQDELVNDLLWNHVIDMLLFIFHKLYAFSILCQITHRETTAFLKGQM